MQREQFYQRRIDKRSLEIEEGKRLVRGDLQDMDLEKQLVQFKKQLFAQEMQNTWQLQSKYKHLMINLAQDC